MPFVLILYTAFAAELPRTCLATGLPRLVEKPALVGATKREVASLRSAEPIRDADRFVLLATDPDSVLSQLASVSANSDVIITCFTSLTVQSRFTEVFWRSFFSRYSSSISIDNQ